MGIRPLLSALMRSRTGPILVALQVAITLAILVNAAYVIMQRKELIQRPTGVDVPNLFWMISTGFDADLNYDAMIRDDLERLRATPGVLAATIISSTPLSSGGSSQTYYTEAAQKGRSDMTAVYLTDERAVDTLGVRLIEGRMFDRSVVPPLMPSYLGARENSGPEIVVTAAFAKKLFPDGNALGQIVYGRGDRPARIVGIMERMLGPWPQLAFAEQVTLIPAIVASAATPSVTYLVRATPERRDALMGSLPQTLEQSQPGRIIARVESLAETYRQTLSSARASAMTLGVVVVLVVAIASLGILGLATFNVTARTKQIGIRRALGALRSDILHYFLVENWLITTTGVLAGSAVALAIGIRLSLMFQAPRLPLYYLVTGILAMWLLGLCATWVPARRAASISPAIATRTV